MSAKLKSIISPGLVNLIILEFAFLLLAVYAGLCMWTGLPASGNTPVMEFVAGVIVFFAVYHSKR